MASFTKTLEKKGSINISDNAKDAVNPKDNRTFYNPKFFDKKKVVSSINHDTEEVMDESEQFEYSPK